MGTKQQISNRTVATLLLGVWISLPWWNSADAQTVELDRLFDQLQESEQLDWETVEADIWREWSKSGSAAMDLLLKRGRDALEAGDTKTAIEHFTALTDHAPDFAEGWNMRATAFFHAGLYGPSIADIRRTLVLNPRHFGAMGGLATILEETGQPEKALEVWRAAQSVHPHQPNINGAVERLEREISGRDL